MDLIDIKLDGVVDPVAQRHLFSVYSDIHCLEGSAKQCIDGKLVLCDAAIIKVYSLHARIVGGQEFRQQMNACEKDPQKIKGLAWEYISRSITMENIATLMSLSHREGVQEGRSAVQDTIKAALGIEE